MERKLKLAIAGDLAPIRGFAPLIEQDPEGVYGDVLPELRRADYRIVNLESPLWGTDFIVKSGAAFAGKPEHLSVLTTVPFDAVTLANNHAFDTGTEGFERTRAMLDGAGIAHTGAGDDSEQAAVPLKIEKNGLRIAVFNFSEGEDMRAAAPGKPGVSGWEPDDFCARIKAAKQSGKYHAVIVVVHCGLEYYPFPPKYVYDTFAQLAAAGADLIVGHHVHVPQGMVRFGNVPAYFSLGNFLFFQDNTLLHRKTGYFLEAEISEAGIGTVTPVPYRIHAGGLRLLDPEEKAAFMELFARLSAPLKTAEGAQQAWNACLAWYGIKGYREELERILHTLRDTPRKGAAMLRNRVQCMQHRMHWTDGLTRIADDTITDVDPELVELTDRFFHDQVPQ
ncbi:MAG: CapA family protein [Lentisphaeria bacterium]|nr:CapA family protein [Lentisphaeria bacterium]